jgi:hypothetical protein
VPPEHLDDGPHSVPPRDREEPPEAAERADDGDDEYDDEPAAWVGDGPVGDVEGFIRLYARAPVTIGHGPAAGRDVNFRNVNFYYGATPPRALRPGPVDTDTLDYLTAAYIEVDAYDRLRHGLRRYHVQVLRGHQGAGRTTTALLALCGLDKPVLRLPSLESMQQLVESDLPGGFGYTIELTRSSSENSQQLDLAVLDRLRYQMRSVDAYLVIVTEDLAGLEGVAKDEYVVPCSAPPGLEVFRKYLTFLEGNVREAIRQLLKDQQTAAAIEEEAKQASGPAVALELIDYLANAASERQSPEQVVNGLRSQLRKNVMRWLLGEPSGNGVKPERSVWDVATLLACCVLDRYPLGRVLAAAGDLATRLHQIESPGGRPTRPVLHDTVQACEEFVRIVEPYEPWSDWYSRWHTPRVQVREEKLLRVVLEVVWRRLNAAREPVIGWLRDLAARHRGSTATYRVACSLRALGVLAQIDFDHVNREVLGPWAGDWNERLNTAAVQVLAVALEDQRTSSTVRLALRQWSREGASWSKRRTALLAYGTLGTEIPVDDVLRAVRDIDSVSHRPQVVRAIAALVERGGGDRVLRDLAARVDANDRRGMEMFMALLRRGNGVDLPDLRAALLSPRAPSASQIALTRLWVSVLQSPSTTAEAWRWLRDWVTLVDHQPEMMEPLSELLNSLMREPGLAARLLFVLRLWHGDRHPPERAAQLLLKRVSGLE